MTRMSEATLRGAIDAVVGLFVQRGGAADDASHGHKELAVRELEEHFGRAADLGEFELMERDWSRRDGGGMRAW
jgi:hypothetical protein